MKVTITASDGVRDDQTVTREGEPERGLDELLIYADGDIRRACDQPQHYRLATRWLASLPHPSSEVLARWQGATMPLSLTDFVDGLRPLIPAGSVAGPGSDPGSVLDAWRQIVTLVGADDPLPLPLSPASVVDRVAMAVEAQKRAQQ